MEKRRLEVDGPGYSYPRSDSERSVDNVRGALLFRALLRARECAAVLVVGEPSPSVAHANLARIVESGEIDGTPFVLAEDLRDARTVAELIATEGAAHWQEAVFLGRGLARALDALHSAGLAHGDLGLSSVHVTKRWEPLLARQIVRGEDRAGLVERNLRELGAILYALVTGQLPAPSPVAPRALHAEVPLALEDVILDLLDGDMASAARAALLLDAL